MLVRSQNYIHAHSRSDLYVPWGSEHFCLVGENWFNWLRVVPSVVVFDGR